MKKIRGWEYDLEKKVYIQEGFNLGDLDNNLGTDKHGDVKNKNVYDPNFVRWSNTFEVSQQIRFMTVLSFIRDHFTEIGIKEKRKRKKLIIDLGCSRSFIYRKWKGNMNYFGWPIIHYWGVDSSLKRINEGRDSFVKKRNDSLAYFVGDLNKELFFPGKADVITCLEVLEHIEKENAENLMKTIYDSLRDDGIAIISSPNPKEKDGWVWGEESKSSHHHEYIWEEAKGLFEEFGFKILDVTGVLPDRNYFRRSKFKKERDKMTKYFPSSFVNNLFLLIEDDMDMKRQWICKIMKK